MISDLLTRGVERVYPGVKEWESRLAAGRPLKIYFGIDPTGPTLHLGHATVLLKLRDFQALGHEIIILIGDFTAAIGDPSGKISARRMLSGEEIAANFQLYEKQITRLLDPARTVFRRNSEWLGELTLAETLKIASEFTVSQLLERDMFDRRLKAQEPIYLHEFLYPLLQGYDSVALGVDAEIGANDQTFNMLAGRSLLKNRGQEKLVLATKLLVDPSGKKMGKTEDNMVTFEDEPKEIYGQVMSWPDELLPLGFEICTRRSLEETTTLIKSAPRDAKMLLAKDIVTVLRGEAAAAAAEESFIKVFQKQELPADLPTVSAAAGTPLAQILLNAGLVKSKSDFQRLIKSGAVSLAFGAAFYDPQFAVTESAIFQIGKRRFLKIVVL